MGVSQHKPLYSVDAYRRRKLPQDEAALLANVLAVHGEIAQAGLDPHRVVDVVTRRAQELTHSSGAVVEVLDGDDLLYWSATGTLTSQLGARVNVDRSLSGLCVKDARVLRCDDSDGDPRVDIQACRRVGLRSLLVAPLPYAGATIGVLKVVSPYIRAYSADDERTLSLLNNLIGTTLSHAAHHFNLEATVNSKAAADDLVLAERAAVSARIQDVVEREAFHVALQPVMRLQDETIVGFEALARFHGPHARTPDVWFAEAHEAGVGLELELALVRNALARLASLPGHAYMAINVSPDTASSPALEYLCRHSDPRRIVLEITEHASVDDYAFLAERARVLKTLGVRLAIDDAGAGFASLRHVLHLEPDMIKLDQSITRGIDTRKRHQNLAAALLTFAKDTSANIVAEGIETSAELQMLKELGVPFGQGYLLSRPLTMRRH